MFFKNLCALDESSLSIERVKILQIFGYLSVAPPEHGLRQDLPNLSCGLQACSWYKDFNPLMLKDFPQILSSGSMILLTITLEIRMVLQNI